MEIEGMEKKAKVPTLRFPGFTDEWEQRKLGELVDKYEDIVLTPHNGYMRLGIRSHAKGTFYSYVEKGKELDTVKMNRVGLRNFIVNITFAWEHAVAITDEKDAGKLVSHRFPQFKFRTGLVPEFFRYVIIDEKFRQHLELVSPGGAGRNRVLKIEDMLQYKMKFPCEIEQRKIAIFFSNLDNLITLHQRKLTHLQAKKKSLLQKMFPKKGERFPELRFPGFTDAWEQRKLGEISEKITTKNSSLEYTETFTNSAEYGIISQRDFFDKDISNKANLTGYYIVQDDDFVYNPRISTTAPVGPIKRNKLGRTGVMSPLYYVFKTHDIDNTFLEKYFGTTGWHEFMYLNGDSGARADRFAIKDAVLCEMPVPYPSVMEQKKIGQFLKNLDNLITLHQRKLVHLQRQKKALLQQMFV